MVEVDSGVGMDKEDAVSWAWCCEKDLVIDRSIDLTCFICDPSVEHGVWA